MPEHVRITKSFDKIKAFIMLLKHETYSIVSEAELIGCLVDQGIVYGVKDDVLKSLVNNPIYDEEILIAEGIKPVNGRDGIVTYHFDIKRENRPNILVDGSVDYKNLSKIESVNKGKVLCTFTLPTMGTPGKSVEGKILKSINGKKVRIPKGKNVSITKDGLSLVASIDGQVMFFDGKVNVFATYEVPADVGNTTGNIKFIGNVVVRGNVLSGFDIDAGGFVEVLGVVEGATIKAGADIILRRGMHGMNKGVLISGADVISSYIEHSTVYAKNDIKADAIMHSQICCGNRVQLSGRKGLLVGGNTKAGREVIAKVIGSPMSTKTEIEVGLDPALKEQYKALREELQLLQNDLKKTSQVISLLQKMQSAGSLKDDKKEMLGKSIRTRIFQHGRISEIKTQISNIETKMQEETKSTVTSYSIIYSGTSVAIGSAVMNVKDPLHYCTLYKDGVDVRVGPIKA